MRVGLCGGLRTWAVGGWVLLLVTALSGPCAAFTCLRAHSHICLVQSRPSGWVVVNYLVDPASSHMLVSKIKPCMSQFRP